jgi:SAM-dependent methyltransferase
VADLACGSGRSAVWLALRGWRVIGVDRDPDALALASRLAAVEGVGLDLVRADLRRPESLPAGPWSAVVMMRYLQRDLIALLPRLLDPGGVVLLRTFRDAVGFTGPPRARHRLGSGELPRLFPADDWEMLVLEESFDPDGRPAAGVVARRR